MYATLSLKKLMLVLVWPFGLIMLGFLGLRGVPTDGVGALRAIGTVVTIWSITLVALFGFSGYWAPWRILWRLAPFLNHKAFPDLNGVWAGTTQSNWGPISALLAAAEGKGKLERTTLAAVPLKTDGITMTITASLFAFRIRSELEATGAVSHSLTERVSQDKRRGAYELYYVYRQETPEPELSDDDSHLGAACLTIDLAQNRLTGAYWTKRSWRSGLNTAGRLELTRRP